MVITKKQTRGGWPVVLLLLLAPVAYASAQEQAPPPPPPPPISEAVDTGQATVIGADREEILGRVRDSANRVNYKLMTATAKVEQIVGRLNTRLAKSTPADTTKVADAKRLLAEAEMSLVNAAELLKDNHTEIERLVKSDNLRGEWQNLEFRFRATADEIRNAIQNISVVTDILLSGGTGTNR